MAEIIKHGKYYGNKVTCQYCGCVFIASTEDYIMSEKRIGGKRVVVCPECGREVTVYGNDRPYDWMNDDNTFKIHPEDDPTYNYFDIHVDKYDLSKKFDFDAISHLPDDYNDYISKINSIDNYKLPDDYKIPDGYKLVRDCSKCQHGPCFGGSDFPAKDGGYTNSKYEIDYEKVNSSDSLLSAASAGTKSNNDDK